ncbi:hypothetical protein LPJ59_000741 [Coemansia sp. RSA 2399]|nr:hypothetical protein LPJ59_000741 [Coemansia sp. RSA 2399]
MDLNLVCAADTGNYDGDSIDPMSAAHELNNIKAALSGFSDQQHLYTASSSEPTGSQHSSTTPPLTSSSDASMFSSKSDSQMAIGSALSAPNSAPPNQQRFSQSRNIGALASLAAGMAETVRTIQDAIHTPLPPHHGFASNGAASSAMKDSATSVFGLAAPQHQTISQEHSGSAEDNESTPTDSDRITKKQANSILEKYRGELNEVAEKCKVLSQFAEQYGPERNRFGAQPSDDLVIDMARKAYEVLMVFMTIRRERMSTSVDDDTMEYIRKRRTVLSPARAKSRKRSKRADAAQPNTCRSCGISETPEWRRGPDGARTLCNACGLHYAKLNKKRAHEATSHGPLSGIDSTDSTPPTSATAAASGAATASLALPPAQQPSPPQALSQQRPIASSSDHTMQVSQPVSPYTGQQYSGNPHMHPQSAGATPHERKVFQPLFSHQQQQQQTWQQHNAPVSWQQQQQQQGAANTPHCPPDGSYPSSFAQSQQPQQYGSSENHPYYHRPSLPSIYSADNQYANNRQQNQPQQQAPAPGQSRQQSASSISRIIG